MLASIGPVAAQTPGLIAGVVRTPDSIARGARVVLSGNTSRTSTADSAGHFVFPDVPPGQYLLVASLEGFSPTTIGATVRGGDTVTLAILLGGPPQLAEVTVTAPRNPTYLADSATGGTKFPVPLLDLPQDVAVVTRALIDDRAITNTRDLTQNVSGVIALPGYDGGGQNEADFMFRGIPSSSINNTLRDGFRDFALLTPRDLSSVERVEFLKGPASVLYGSVGSIGGLANFVTKKPLARREAQAILSSDDHGTLRSTLDLGGPFSASGAWRYRLNLAGERIRGFRAFSAGSFGFSVAPAVEWVPNSRTSILITGEYTQRRFRSDQYMPLYSGVFDLPISNFYGEPGLPLDLNEGVSAQVVVTYRLGGATRLREGLGYTTAHAADYSVAMLGVDSAAGTELRLFGFSDEGSKDFASQTELLWDIRTGSVRQRAVAGLELSTEQINHVDDGAAVLPPISIQDPEYGAVPTDAALTPYHDWIPVNQVGVYVQDLLDLGRHFKAVVGARFDANTTKHYRDDLSIPVFHTWTRGWYTSRDQAPRCMPPGPTHSCRT